MTDLVSPDEKPSEAVLSVAQALGVELRAEILQRLAQAALLAMQDAPQQLAALNAKLHADRAHPDWQYETVIHGRKQSDGRAPEGEGWERNHDFNDGSERFDHEEEEYWRRPMSFKEAELEAARQPLLEAVALLRRAAEWLRTQKDKIEKDVAHSDYWGSQTYAQGIGGAVDGDYGSLAATFGPVAAQWLATSLEAYADDLSYRRAELDSQATFGLLALAESLVPSPTT